MKPRDIRLGPAQRKVLWAILDAADHGKHLTYRDVMRLIGSENVNAAWRIIDTLRRKGLILSEPSGHRTIRPAVRIEMQPYPPVHY